MLWIAFYFPELPLQIVERATPHARGETSSTPFIIKQGAEQRPLVFAAKGSRDGGSGHLAEDLYR